MDEGHTFLWGGNWWWSTIQLRLLYFGKGRGSKSQELKQGLEPNCLSKPETEASLCFSFVSFSIVLSCFRSPIVLSVGK